MNVSDQRWISLGFVLGILGFAALSIGFEIVKEHVRKREIASRARARADQQPSNHPSR